MLSNEINTVLKFNGSLGIVLGSGLDHIVDFLNDKIILPYNKIDSFPSSTVDGHKGELISGYFLEKQILIARGRLHLYEGIKIEEVIKMLPTLDKTTKVKDDDLTNLLQYYDLIQEVRNVQVQA